MIILAAITVFAAVNWGTFTAPTSLSLIFGTVQAPLGLVMLGLLAVLTALFILFGIFVRASALIDSRRRERELQAMRELAEHAELSRFTKLQELFQEEAQRRADMDRDSRAEILTRLDKLETALTTATEQSGNSLAAYIGELEDKVERATRRDSSPPAP